MSEHGAKQAMTRRAALRAGAGLASLLVIRPVLAGPAEMEAALRAFVGGGRLRPGKVRLDLPPLVENGNSVPLSVTVDHPMLPDDYVRTIAVFNERNPQPHVAVFHLSPRCGRAFASTRMRLGDSQRITAVAELSDGTFWSDEAEVIVTLPACSES
jgi:sulfur-oxidizing protein SoxY